MEENEILKQDQKSIEFNAVLLKGLSDLYDVYTSYKEGLYEDLDDSKINRIETFFSTMMDRLTTELYSETVEK